MRASKLPGYSVGGSSSRSPARTQSGCDRKPVSTTSLIKHTGGRPTDALSDHSVESDVTPPTTADPQVTDRASTKQRTSRKASHLVPPKTIVIRHQTNGVAAAVPNDRFDIGVDNGVELSTSFAREPGNTSVVTSPRQTGSRSRDGEGQRSRLVPPRTCVQRQQPRDPTTADGT